MIDYPFPYELNRYSPVQCWLIVCHEGNEVIQVLDSISSINFNIIITQPNNYNSQLEKSDRNQISYRKQSQLNPYNHVAMHKE